MVSELSTSSMATKRERIGNLEMEFLRIVIGVLEKLKSLEDAITRLSSVVSSRFGLPVHMAGGNKKNYFSLDTPDNNQLETPKDSQPSFVSKVALLECFKSTSCPDACHSKAETFVKYPDHKHRCTLHWAYQVVGSVSPVYYRLHRPDSSQVHLVCHVIAFKIGYAHVNASFQLTPFDASGLILTRPGLFLDTGQVCKGGDTFSKMAKLQSLSFGDFTWKDCDMLRQRPDMLEHRLMNLEDKVHMQAGGNDRS